jgi:hypothetical protein
MEMKRLQQYRYRYRPIAKCVALPDGQRSRGNPHLHHQKHLMSGSESQFSLNKVHLDRQGNY